MQTYICALVKPISQYQMSSSVFLYLTFLSLGFTVLPNPARLSGKQVPGVLLSCLPSARIIGAQHHG